MTSAWVDQFKAVFKCPINIIPISFSSFWPLRADYGGSCVRVWLNLVLLEISSSWGWYQHLYFFDMAALVVTDHALVLSALAIITWRSGEVVQQLRVPDALPEDLSSVLSTHTGQFTPACNFNSRGPNTLLLAPWASSHMCTYTLHIHKK